MAKRKISESVAAPAIDPDALNQCNCLFLRKAVRRVSQLYDAALAPCGLKSTQRSILVHIARVGAPTSGQLASMLVMDRGALAHNLKPLERDKFISVLVDTEDRRSRRIILTDRGKAKLEESNALWARAQAGFETAFGPEQSAALRSSLHHIVGDAFAETFNQSMPSQKSSPVAA